MSRLEKEDIPEETFSSDEDFEDEEVDTESSSDVDAKLAEDDVFDIEFFKCYSALKKRDDKIYDKNVKFFNEEDKSSSEEDEQSDKNLLDQGNSTKKIHKGPKMTLLDHQLNLNDDNIEEPKIDLTKEVSKSFYQKELDEIKKSIEKVSENINSDEEDDDLLIVKNDKDSSTNAKKRIKDMLDKLENDDDQDISHLKQIWSDPDKLNEEEKFLRNYIVNKMYLPQNATTTEQKQDDGGFFSKNLDDLSDVDSDDASKKNDSNKKKQKVDHHSEEKDFDKITRIPRNSTKTIRDLVEKREKKEKRLKSLEKEKKRKKALKDADFEDMVGDLPTKFHYRETEPNDYGLSAEELLMATDEELETWCKLRDTIAYKTPEQELAEKERYERRRNDLELKRKIFKSIYGDPEEVEKMELEVKPGKKGKKRKSKSNSETADVEPEQPSTQSPEKSYHKDAQQESNTIKRKKKHKRGLNHKKFAKTGVAPDRLLAYGISKNKLKKSKLL